ncbi:MAG: ATP-binding cassette domain-containing protein, partial [Rhodospirillaceae bacterium]|nr:ATP-binding cassette domain-containing protein [Rhodospirillaceae bacterium]
MLEVEGLNAGYGRIPILNGIDFSIARGEIVGVLGHNGMGKTTLLRTLMGEIRATGGSITFEDEDITRLAMHRRARLGIGYVPQGR